MGLFNENIGVCLQLNIGVCDKNMGVSNENIKVSKEKMGGLWWKYWGLRWKRGVSQCLIMKDVSIRVSGDRKYRKSALSLTVGFIAKLRDCK